jgi:uncharacterized membrane protein
MSEHIEKDQHGDQMGFERLVFFSDAVLAIAITLMALEIRLPELEPEQAAEHIGAALQAMFPHILVYVLSFLVIGIYWVVHHRLFRQIKRYDTQLLWLNLIFLMTVAFVPVATNAFGSYSMLPETVVFYAVALSLVGLSEFALFFYVHRKGYLAPSAAKYSHTYFAARILVPPVVFLASILTLPIGVDVAKYFWALMIPILYLLRFAFPDAHKARSAYDSGEV